jgi:hypothetical protein
MYHAAKPATGRTANNTQSHGRRLRSLIGFIGKGHARAHGQLGKPMVEHAVAMENEPNWVIGRKAARRLRREAISASLSERHGRNGPVDLVLRPEGDGPGR